MKKFFASIIAVFFMFQTSVAFAGEIYGMSESTMEPAIKALLSLNRWFYQNNYEGLNYINENYYALREQAIAWDKDVLLLRVRVGRPSIITDSSCIFTFGSPNKPNEIFKATCVDPNVSEIKGSIEETISEISPEELFDLPDMNLRRFVSDILGSTIALTEIRRLLAGDSRNDTYMVLSKVNGRVYWNWQIINIGKTYGISVYKDANDLQSDFVVIEGNGLANT